MPRKELAYENANETLSIYENDGGLVICAGHRDDPFDGMCSVGLEGARRVCEFLTLWIAEKDAEK